MEDEIEFLKKRIKKAKEIKVMQKVKLTIAFNALEKISNMDCETAKIAKVAMYRIYGIERIESK